MKIKKREVHWKNFRKCISRFYDYDFYKQFRLRFVFFFYILKEEVGFTINRARQYGKDAGLEKEWCIAIIEMIEMIEMPVSEMLGEYLL